MYTVQQKDLMGVWHGILSSQKSTDAFTYMQGLQKAHGKSLYRIIETF